MKRVALLFLLGCVALHRVAAATPVVHSGDVVVATIDGEISQSLALYLRRAIKTAESNHAAAFVLQMNTYGGRLDAAEEITSALNHTNIPTYTFINTNAGSAGALIAIATQHIYMAPVSAIGAAAPVLSTGEDLPATARDKAISYFSAMSRASATRNGHNADVAEAFINRDKEVKIGDRVVHAKGSLLSLNAQDATEVIGGRPLLADGTASAPGELAEKASLHGAFVNVEPSGFEQLAFWITALAPVLLLGGILGAYIEFKMPGTTLPAIISAACFALFFLGHYIAGLAGWEVVALFALGVVLVLVEVLFFAHSTIVFGLVGVFLVLASITWAMVDRYPGQRFVPSGDMLLRPLINLTIAIVGSAIAISLLARYLPRTSLYRRFALAAAVPSGTSMSDLLEGEGRPRVAIGTPGIATTTLRPSGKAQFGTRVFDVVTNGEYVAADTPVSVVQLDGMRIVVRPG